MTECTAAKLVFSRLKRQKVEGYFDGGRLTSGAGAMLLREVDRRLGLTSALAACITDPRCLRRIRHDRHRMLTQRVFGIGLGYEDLNDHQSLRDEPLFQVLAEQRPDPDRPLASPATLCRFENRIKEQQLGLFADRTRCHKFLANPFRLLLASAAYVLLEHPRRAVLKGTQLAQARVGTLRVKLPKVAARVTVSVRRVVLHLSSYYPYRQLFTRVAARLVPI